MTESDWVSDLAGLLTLEMLDRDLYRGRNPDYGDRSALFGGQVAAQALMAAGSTVDGDRVVHSLHGYFLRPGLTDRPVILRVERDRDGRSFSARHVAAVQDGAVIFSMLCSFALEQPADTIEDLRHRDAPSPEGLPVSAMTNLVDIREVTLNQSDLGVYTDCFWARSIVSLGDDPLVHAAGLTYVSDFGTGFGQYDHPTLARAGASLDHAMWFHEPIRADEWLLTELRPIKARAGRGLYEGSMRDEKGRLGATIQQELLLRRHPPPPKQAR
ncbi:MAG: acyl-CoA thioesterase domain-containing protein [Acidimicrobiales bacterium]